MQLMAYLQNNPTLLYCTVTVLGLLIGSFLNVVILRIPKMLEREWYETAKTYLAECPNPPNLPKTYNLIKPNSHCVNCGKPVRAWENIPVLGYLFLGGKCSNCKAIISKRYPIIEVTTALLTLLIIWRFGTTITGFTALILTWSLVALTMIDFDHKLLPDNITLPLLWLGLWVNMDGAFVPLKDAVLGAIFGYLSLWSVYWVFKLATKKEGMGFGDFKLLAALGAWLGWQALPSIILISSVIGAIVGLLSIQFFKHDKNEGIPFGPYLAIAGLLTLVWRGEVNALLSLF